MFSTLSSSARYVNLVLSHYQRVRLAFTAIGAGRAYAGCYGDYQTFASEVRTAMLESGQDLPAVRVARFRGRIRRQ